MTSAYFSLQSGPLTQDWTDASLITTNDNWDNVPSIVGFLGSDDSASITGVDPQTVLAPRTDVIDVIANQTNPNTLSSGGVAEFALANPTVALNGSGTADSPFLMFFLDTTGASNITVSYNLRDLDGSADNAISPVALQYRIGETGDFINIPSAFVADASSGPNLATLVTAVTAVLPAEAENQSQVQVRVITTNAVGNDEWIGVDDIVISANDSALAPTVDISALDGDASEEGSDPGTVRFSRTGSTTDALTVNFTVGGDANTADFTPTLTGSVEIPAGQGFVDVVITPVDDSEVEETETLTLTLVSDVAYTVGTNSSASVTITDNDGDGAGSATVTNATAGALNGTDIFDRNTTQDVAIALTGVNGGSLTDITITLPTGWNGLDVTNVSLSGTGLAGAIPSVSGSTLTLSGATLTDLATGTVTLTGLTTPNPTALTDTGNQLFTIQTAASGGTLTSIAQQPQVLVTIPIANLRDVDANGVALDLGTTVAIAGVATPVVDFSGSDLISFVQDDTAGIGLFLGASSLALTQGNTYIIRGPIDQFNGLTQIEPAISADIIDAGAGTLPTPQVFTIADLLANAETLEGSLVEIQNATITSGTFPATGSNANITLDDGTGTLTLRIDADTNIDGTPQPTSPITATGIFSQFDSSNPFTSGYQLLPRDTNDIQGFNPVVPTVTVAATDDDAAEFPTDTGTFRITRTDSQTTPLTQELLVEFTFDTGAGQATNGTDYEAIVSPVIIPANQTFVDVTVTPIDDLDSEGIEGVRLVLTDTDTYDVGTTNFPSITIIDDETNLTPIFTIQGDGTVSPLENSTVTTRGVVVGDFQGSNELDGFFIQDVTGDGNAATSDGIFVFVPQANAFFGTDVQVGDLVQITAEVSEFNTFTQLDFVSDLQIISSGNAVTATPVTLPETTQGELEQFEGMLVSVTNTLTVSQNFFQGRYGQVTLSEGDRLFQPTNQFRPNTPEAIALADENARRLLVLDDGQDVNSAGDNPNPIPYIGEDNTLRAGDTVSNLEGVLDFGQINSNSSIRDYRLHPTVEPVFTRVNDRPDAPESVGTGANLKVASFNVLNYFTTLDDGSGLTGPNNDQEPRGANTATEFTRQRDKIINAIIATDADVLGLVEMENNGDDSNSAIANLIQGLNDATAPGTYDYIRDPAGFTTVPGGDDAIKVAIIYQPGVVTPIGSSLTTDNTAFEIGRAPVAQQFELNGNGEEFFYVVNHFKSKGGGGSATGLDVDQGDGQGAFNATRVEQAIALQDFVNTLDDIDPDVLVMGDLNAYTQEDPIITLTSGGLVNELERFVTDPYSFVFDGQSGALDHALTTPSLSAQVTGVTEWHINADEPSVIDYNEEFKPQDLYTDEPFRSADHDPIVIGLNLGVTFIEGTSGSEILTGTANKDEINGLGGSDQLLGEEGDDLLRGGGGNDTLDGGSGNNTLLGGSGNDTLLATGSNDSLNGGEGNDVLNTLNTGADVSLTGASGNDTLNGGDGNDSLTGGNGNNSLTGGNGNDTLITGGDQDTLNGGAGDDSLNGGQNKDFLTGGEGNDTLVGGNGLDRLEGSIGTDSLTGGAGLDTFAFGSVNEGIDTITDFTPVDDTIELAAAGFGGDLVTGTLPTSQFVLGTVATGATATVLYDGTTGALFFDVDGTGASASVQIAQLVGNPILSNTDILIA